VAIDDVVLLAVADGPRVTKTLKLSLTLVAAVSFFDER